MVYWVLLSELIPALTYNSTYIPQEDTICINHNWSNACNLDKMFDHLKKSLEEVRDQFLCVVYYCVIGEEGDQ